MLARIRDAIAWRIRRRLGDRRVDHLLIGLAHPWRPLLARPLFVGVTGSAGKTTAKHLLFEMLSGSLRGTANPGTLNAIPEVAKTVLRSRPWHDFCISELSESRPGAMDEPLRLLRPRITIVTNVRDDHASAFESRDGIAAEIEKAVAALPPAGTAVLNADDDLVVAMARGCCARVITYGESPAADLRAEDIRAAWPDRLEFTATWQSQRARVSTRLCGPHWLTSALAAIGGGLAAGLTLEECAQGLARAAPFEGRMQPVTTTGGVTFVRDDFKAPLWTVDASLAFMDTARAPRKIIVVGTLSDCGPGISQKYARVARRAQGIADLTVFVGPSASYALKAREAGREDALRVFGSVRAAAEFVNANARRGDLVLLKGTNKQDHLCRIPLARDGEIACWRDDCKQGLFCSECPDRLRPSGTPAPWSQPEAADPNAGKRKGGEISPGTQVIVGLGNPEPRHAGTPHNVGYEVADRLAASIGSAWHSTPEAWVARGFIGDRAVCLLKLRVAMNLTGTQLGKLSQHMGFGPGQCILVFDDLATPIGSVRTRMSGGAGGHRGVASILEAFQTDALRRVKVGVAGPGAQSDRIGYVLAPFRDEDRAAVERAIDAAAARVVQMVSGNVAASTGSHAREQRAVGT